MGEKMLNSGKEGAADNARIEVRGGEKVAVLGNINDLRELQKAVKVIPLDVSEIRVIPPDVSKITFVLEGMAPPNLHLRLQELARPSVSEEKPILIPFREEMTLERWTNKKDGSIGGFVHPDSRIEDSSELGPHVVVLKGSEVYSALFPAKILGEVVVGVGANIRFSQISGKNIVIGNFTAIHDLIIDNGDNITIGDHASVRCSMISGTNITIEEDADVRSSDISGKDIRLSGGAGLDSVTIQAEEPIRIAIDESEPYGSGLWIINGNLLEDPESHLHEPITNQKQVDFLMNFQREFRKSQAGRDKERDQQVLEFQAAFRALRRGSKDAAV